MNDEPKLGIHATDAITGFTGIVMGICHYHGTETSVLVVGQSKDGKEAPSAWFSPSRLEWKREEEPIALPVNS